MKRAVVELGIFSAATNVLLLVSPIYMLQVYDRVLPSSSFDTLIYISIAMVGALVVLGVIEVVRSIYANRIAARLDINLGPEAFLASLNGSRAAIGDVQPLRDLATIRGFIASRSVFFLFDLPFAPLFLIVLYFIHPVLCAITMVGVVVMILIAWLNQMSTSQSGKKAGEALNGAMNTAQSFARNFETVRALGMTSNVLGVWGGRFADSLVLSDRVASVNAVYGGISRFVRIVLQSAILGIGAYFVLTSNMSAGMIFASSLISGRALQPFDQVIGGWRLIIDSWAAWKRLAAMSAEGFGKPKQVMTMPPLRGAISAEQLIYAPQGTDQNRPLIKRISFVIQPGELVAIIGPSRAGKSTLARLIVGALKPNSGVVRMDGADIANWDPDVLGGNIGYLAQEVELFPGTIAQNIARFDAKASDEKVIEAATNARAHQLILNQGKDYLTPIGPGGVRLSGGERQRIGLARAFYGEPKIMVLDEPNSNLDTEGEQALETALLEARTRGVTGIVITHKPSIAMRCDRILMLRDGQIEMFGPAAEVLQKLGSQNAKPPAAPASGPEHAAAVQPAAQAVKTQRH